MRQIDMIGKSNNGGVISLKSQAARLLPPHAARSAPLASNRPIPSARIARYHLYLYYL